ncbi:MAG TPA: hypothetical protein VF556_06100 [Pyrinomonadaceae bacterium]|jgi:hypothetical protein
MKTLGIIIIAFLLTAPLAVVTPILPFLVLIFLYFICRFSLVGFLKGERLINRGFASAAVLLIPVAFALPVLEGDVFASGPFYGSKFNGDIQILSQTDSVAYGSGELIAYAADENHEPVLAYVVDGQVHWAIELQTGDDPAFKIYKLSSLRVRKGLLRDRVEFFATGTSEPGWAFVWKFGGVQKFYLKMF